VTFAPSLGRGVRVTLVPPLRSRPNFTFVAPLITAMALKRINAMASIAIGFADFAEVFAPFPLLALLALLAGLCELLKADMRGKSRHLKRVCRKYSSHSATNLGFQLAVSRPNAQNLRR